MKVVRKRILAVILSLAMILPALCVTTEVRAADYTEYGSYKPGEWNDKGERTTVWDFTDKMPSSNKSLKAGDTINGIVVDTPVKASLHSSNYVKFTGGTVFSIPVSENTTSATITITMNNASSSRKITAGGETKDFSTGTNTWEITQAYITSNSFTITGTEESHITEIKLVETRSTGGGTGGDTPITAVTVAPKTASVKAGGTVDLTATITPANTTQSKDINWSSSNTDVATVDNNGKVTAVAEGTATITAVSAANNTISDTCEITVTANTSGGVIAITGVTLDKKNASVKVGGGIDLTATVVPTNTTLSKDINWTSSDTNIATVDANGHVTAVSAGEATITAASVADSNFSATCKVVVIANGGGGNSGNMEAGGWNETIYAQIAGISKADVTAVSYSGTMSGELTGDDFKYLVRDLNGGGTA